MLRIEATKYRHLSVTLNLVVTFTLYIKSVFRVFFFLLSTKCHF